MPDFYMLVGLPGSGKSYFATNQMKGSIISSDYHIDRIAAFYHISYNKAFSAIKFAEQMMYEDFEYAIGIKDDIIWDQTNLTVKSRASKLKEVPDFYNKYCIYFPLPNEKEYKERISLREMSGKKIPQNVMESMKANFEIPTINEGFIQIMTPQDYIKRISQLEQITV